MRINRRTDRQIERGNGKTDRQKESGTSTDRQRDGQTGKQMGQINRQTDVWKGDGQADRWTVGLID